MCRNTAGVTGEAVGGSNFPSVTVVPWPDWVSMWQQSSSRRLPTMPNPMPVPEV